MRLQLVSIPRTILPAVLHSLFTCGVSHRKRHQRGWDYLSDDEKTLLNEFNSGQLTRCRNECDAAFGWDKQQRDAAGSAAARLTHHVPA